MGNDSCLIVLVDLIRRCICNALAEQGLHINLGLGGNVDVFLPIERNQYMEHLLANLILHHSCNLVRILAGQAALFVLRSVDLISCGAVNDYHILCFQPRYAGGYQKLNCFGLLDTGRSAVLHGQHNVACGFVQRVFCKHVFPLLTQGNGYLGVLYPVNHPYGSCNPFLQVIQGIAVLVGVCGHQTCILGIYLIAEAALWIALESQACPCLIQYLLRNPDDPVLGILVINLRFLELAHNLLGLFCVQSGKQDLITTVSVQKQGYHNGKNDQASNTGQYNLFCPALQFRNNRL